MIYFDNAATGGFKPNRVIDNTVTSLKYLCANPGRSGHRLSLTGEKIIYSTREILAKYFDADVNRVIFTKNCTEALNVAIFGTLKKGDHVICSVYEHNSVLRPLFYLKSRGDILLDVVDDRTCPLEQAINEKINPQTKLICISAISNVLGKVLPIKKIGKICKEKNIVFLVDGAQGGGHIPLSLKNDDVNILCLASHKGLYGIMGSGVLIFDEKTEITPLMFGGTGSESFNLIAPNSYPEKLEVGTLNLPAISALNEGAKYSMENLDCFSRILTSMTSYLIEKLEKLDNVSLYSLPNPAGIVAFSISNLSSMEVADILNNDYDVAVRGGFHCAPLLHKFLQTDLSGLIRVSLSPQNTYREINFFLDAIYKIAKI